MDQCIWHCVSFATPPALAARLWLPRWPVICFCAGPDGVRQKRPGRRPGLTRYAVINIFGQVNISPAELFAALSHDTRLRCMLLLFAYEELCVCELTHAVGGAQPHMSRHLAHLREAGMVSDRRDGLWIHYRINPDLPSWVAAVIEQTAQGVCGLPPYVQDRAALSEHPGKRGQARCA